MVMQEPVYFYPQYCLRDRSFITSQGGGGGFDRGVCFLTLVTLGGLSFNIF